MTTAEELKEIEKWTKKKKEADAKIQELLMPVGLREGLREQSSDSD